MYAEASTAEDADRITRFTSSKGRTGESIEESKKELLLSLQGMMNSYRFFTLFSSIKPMQKDFGSSRTLFRRCKKHTGKKRPKVKYKLKVLNSHHLSMTFLSLCALYLHRIRPSSHRHPVKIVVHEVACSGL